MTTTRGVSDTPTCSIPGMKASALVKQERLTLLFEDDPKDPTPEEERTLNVTIDPSILTAALEAEINAKGESMEVIVDAVCALIAEWDLVDDKKKVIPLKHDALKSVPSVVLVKILNEISKNVAENAKQEGKASAAS
jgi:hypothetical protein